jgi:ribosomal protein S6--L-glutamate ligase
MRIKILARIKNNYSNKRLIYEAQRRGHLISTANPLDYKIVLNKKNPLLYKNDSKLRKVDIVLPRMGASISNYALAVVNQFEMMGMVVINRSMALMRSRDKLRCLQFMTRKNIDIPRTVVIRKPSEIRTAVDFIGGFPVVLKLLSGSQGIGVMLAENYQTIESTLDTLWSLGQEILLQECIRESFGKDIRAFVVGDRVVAAMRRQARIGEFRSNLHRGGTGTTVNLDKSVQRVAVQAAKVVGLDIAGVDMLESNEGPKVMEVNSSPGLEGIEQATESNIAGEIIEYAENFVRTKYS